MKFLKCLLLFGSCMSTSSGKLHGGADELLQYSSDNGSDDSGITKKIDQLIKQNRDNKNLLMYAIKAEKGATYLKKKSNRDSYRIQEAVAQGYPVTYSSRWGKDYANPRIRDTSNKVKAWCARVNNQKQWIQVNLIEPKIIQAIQMAKRGDQPEHVQWVKTYKVSYTENGIDWKYYKNGQLLQGDNKKTELTPFKAKIVRVHPWTWHSHISLRFEVFFTDKMTPTYTRKLCRWGYRGSIRFGLWINENISYCKAKCNAASRCGLMVFREKQGYQGGYKKGFCKIYTGGSTLSKYIWYMEKYGSTTQCFTKD